MIITKFVFVLWKQKQIYPVKSLLLYQKYNKDCFYKDFKDFI